MGCCGQCGGEGHAQAEKEVEEINKDQASVVTQSQDAEQSED